MGLLGIYLNEILFGYSSWNVAESVSMKMKFFVIINVIHWIQVFERLEECHFEMDLNCTLRLKLEYPFFEKVCE